MLTDSKRWKMKILTDKKIKTALAIKYLEEKGKLKK